MKKINKEILNIYYKYDKDFGLLNEPWAKKEDKELVNFEVAQIFGKYIEGLELVNNKFISEKLKEVTRNEIKEMELYFENDVIDLLKMEYGNS